MKFSRLPVLFSAAVMGASALRVSAVTFSGTAIADNSIYENTAQANGAGEFLFTGTTNGGITHRALLKFDFSSIPAGATITSVSISLVLSKAPPGDAPC